MPKGSVWGAVCVEDPLPEGPVGVVFVANFVVNVVAMFAIGFEKCLCEYLGVCVCGCCGFVVGSGCLSLVAMGGCEAASNEGVAIFARLGGFGYIKEHTVGPAKIFHHGPYQADSQEVHWRQGPTQAAGHQGCSQVSPCYRRCQEAPSLQARYRRPQGDQKVPEIH